jgi:putative modified peptide
MIRGTPSDDAIAKVLERLSTDHDFREQMLGDPVAAMKSHGIDVDPQGVPATRKLPSMDEVAAIHKQFVADPKTDKSCIAVLLVVGAK